MHTVVVALLLLGAVAMPLSPPPAERGQAGAAPDAPSLAVALQTRYDTIRDFSADFVQTHAGGVLGRTREERGSLLVKKPGKMRWTYTSPEEKLFVSDGRQLYYYVPAENRVRVSTMPQSDEGTAAILFLAGRGNLARDFTAAFAEGGGPDVWALRLTPRRAQAEYDWLEIVMARDSLQIRSLVVAENGGARSTYRLSNFKENPGLADKSFEFTMPRGAEVSYASPDKR